MRVRFPTCLLCLALLIGYSTVPIDPARAEAEMTFRAVQIGHSSFCGYSCPTIISATGQITPSTPSRFLDFIQNNYERRNLHAVVFIDSPGGRVFASMELGTLMRKVGAAAVVARVASDGNGGSIITNAQCFSACVYALMGARKRVIPGSSQVGIHRMFAYEDHVDMLGSVTARERRYDNGDMRSYLIRYSNEMVVSPALIAAAEHVPSDTLHILSRKEIQRWHLGVPRL